MPLQYIFGYGSLMQIESRTRTVPSAIAASPAIVKGISRGWYQQADGQSLSPTYLGAVADVSATTNGVIYGVTDAELAATDAREAGYVRLPIDGSAITMLDGGPVPSDVKFWYYACEEKKPVNDKHPIVQSYVDMCVDGCLEIEEMYPLASEAHFAQRFIETCTDWGTPWINDRIFPYRPFIYMRRAHTIDKLLSEFLPGDLFHKIVVA